MEVNFRESFMVGWLLWVYGVIGKKFLKGFWKGVVFLWIGNGFERSGGGI